MSDGRGEAERIREVYRRRDASGLASLYAWHRADVRLQNGERDRELAALLHRAVGDDLSGVDVLDVGCGDGRLLRRLVEWGADPRRLTGIDLMEDRIEAARLKSPPGIRWSVADAGSLAGEGEHDLVTAFTVFSSILDDGERRALATTLWDLVRPGGWIVLFDFRMGNPRNPDVRPVRRRELRELFPACEAVYRSLLLAPPLARRLAPVSPLLTEVLTWALPPLRSHFHFLARKP